VYQVLLTKKAERSLAKAPVAVREKIIRSLTLLETDPFVGKPLKAEFEGLWTLRAWPFRIIYEIKKGKLIVLVLVIAHRKDVYR
jgi:mRNA interferase RelE/StbE